MATMHIESRKEEISDVVLMPGDPNRAKYIAEKFLSEVKVVNNVRNLTAYTGYYKDKLITVFPSGMGIPSACIYTYELFTFYDVKKIIRIGTAGAFSPDANILDVVLAESSYSISTYPLLFDGDNINEVEASKKLNKKIIDTAKSLNINLKFGKTITSDVFDLYVDKDKFKSNFPDENYLACEMEGFGILYLAKKLNKEASIMMSIVDSKFEERSLTSEEREKSLNEMITLALESVL